ncbi:alkaline phosphatase [Geminocystis sp. NIES-3708]|nr:alkaline phosphatase [Geminocystis sp. NIES-3708]
MDVKNSVNIESPIATTKVTPVSADTSELTADLSQKLSLPEVHSSSTPLIKNSLSSIISRGISPPETVIKLQDSSPTFFSPIKPLQAISAPSGDYRIDALLGGNKWGITNLTYSFYAGGSFYGSETGLASVSEAVKNNVRYILNNLIAPLINLTFTEVTDSPSNYGQLRYLLSTDPGYAYAYYPFSTDTNQGNGNDVAGDVFLNPDYDNNFDTNGFRGGAGTHGYQSLIHETLHALGIKHSGNYNGSGAGDPPYLPYGEENWDNTLMTYNFDSGDEPSTPMAYDILALQYLYGAKSYNSNNTIYTFSDTDLYSDGSKTVGSSTLNNKITIWDSGGTDILNFTGLGSNTGGYRFDMNPGGWFSTQTAFNGTGYNVDPGPPVSFSSGTTYRATTNGTRLGYGIIIEHLVNSSSNDYIIANSAANQFSGYGVITSTGNDTIEGGNSLDTLDLSEFTSSSVSQIQSGNNLVLGLGSARSITVKDYYLTSTDRLNIQFSSTNILTSFAIAATNANQTEGNSGTKAFTFTINRSGTTTGANNVNWAVTGSGTNPANATDFSGGVLPSGTVSFAANETSKVITVNVQGDTTVEPDENFTVTLSNATNGATITTATATGTILNDDGTNGNTFSNTSTISIPEIGPASSYPSTINVSGLSGNISKVTVTLNNLSHTFPDDLDILLVSPTGAKTLLMSDVGESNDLSDVTLTFDPTATNFLPDSGLITSGTYKPTDFESDDVFDSPAPVGPYNADLSVFNNTNPNGEWRLFVVDDISGDFGSIAGGLSLTFETTASFPTTLAIAATNANQTEGNSGTKAFTFTVTRSGTTTGANNVNWAVTGSGTNPANATDFSGGVLPSGTVSFAANETSKVITVNVQGDTTVEPDENFTVTLSNATNGATITTATAIGTIQNDDTPIPTNLAIAATNANQTEGNSGTKAFTFTVTRSGTTTGANNVNWAVTGSGTNPANATDFSGGVLPSGTVSFAANETSKVITVNVQGDTTVEPDENFTVTLSNATNGATITTATAIGTIQNDDTNTFLPQISISPNQTVIEGLTSLQNVTYTVILSQASSQTVTVQYATTNGTAIAGSDYTATSGTLTFSPGQISKTIILPILNDFVNEFDENFNLTLSNSTNANLSNSGVTTTIADTLFTAVTTTLSANVENLILTGITAINGTGNGGNNIISGNTANNNLNGGAGNDTLNDGDGNDTLDGGAGSDVMSGGLGNDFYYVNSTVDVVVENASQGTDTVISSITHTLAANVENLTLIDISAINGTGNTLNNTITGNIANNNLNGGDGNDTLTGGDGNDTLNGGTGSDRLTGGTGNDLYLVDNVGDIVSETSTLATEIDTVQSSITYTLTTNVENLTLTGTSAINGTGNTLNNTITGNIANNNLNGGDGNDTLTGGDGNDTLNGSIGSDRLTGGTGNDLYIVDNLGDIVIETSTLATEIDTVQSLITYTLTTNVENLTLTGTSAINGTGNILNNTITGNIANNNLNGGDGNDTLTGGDGNDTLNGGTGSDRLTSGTGNDLYIVDNVGDIVIETSTLATEIDTVQSSITYTLTTNVENLTLTGTSAINGTGNTLNNTITGNIANNNLNGGDGNDTLTGGDGNDTLNGGTGSDRLTGGTGNDLYIVDNVGDIVSETSTLATEIDTVQSSITYTLTTNVENLTLTGTTAINGTGNTLNNTITGNTANNSLDGGAGNDTLNGGTGIDSLIGGTGNDLYIVDNVGDIVSETSTLATEIDTVQSSITYTLTDNVENLTLTGTTAINGTGNTLKNVITGNSGNNSLSGGDGNDTLIGGDGNDTLIGGGSNDTLTGGNGLDSFRFNSASEGVDFITDFTVADDTIRVLGSAFGGGLVAGTLSISQFTIGSSATTSSHRFFYNSSNGGLFFDVDGNGATSAVQFATLNISLTMTNADIVVI